MEGNATPAIIDDFEGITGGWGLVRLVAPFGSTAFNTAVDEAEFTSRADAYFAQSEIQTALARGTCAITVNGPPPWRASATPLYGAAFVPADNTEGGTWQDLMTLFVQRAKAVLGSLYRAPRNAQGQVEIGQPGLLWECGNEWGGGTGTQLSNAKTTYKRFWQGIIDEDPDAAVILPQPVTYNIAEGTGKTFIREMCEFAGANACAPHVVNWHNFQGVVAEHLLPTEDVAEAAAEVSASLSAGGLSASTPRVITEFQTNFPGTPGINARNNYQSAAYTASALWEHWQRGVSGMCMASLVKQGDVPSDAAPFAESGSFAGWGMVTKGTVKIPTAQFSLMKLFALWDGGMALPVRSHAPKGIRSFCAVNGSDVIVLASRWHPGGGTLPLDIAAQHPGKTLTEARIYRFDATTNNVQKVFTDTVGTDLVKGDAARAAGLAPGYTTATNGPVSLQFAPVDTVLVRFIFA